MQRKAKFAILFLWVLVGISLIVFVSFINDKPKIQQENQNYLTMNQAGSGITNFLNSSASIVKNSPIKIP